MLMNRISGIYGIGSAQYSIWDTIKDGVEGLVDSASDIANDVVDFGKDVVDTAKNLGDSILDAISTALSNFFGHSLWLADCCLCKLVDMLYKMFSVFVGMTKVTYYQTTDSGQTSMVRNNLINILIDQDSISILFNAMAIIGILLSIAFTVFVVIRKAGDLYDNEHRTLGQILSSLFKSTIIILLMNFIMVVVLSFSGVLMTSISNAFDIATFGGKPKVIVYTSEDYAKMYKVLSTIGTYSLHPSYTSRYNLNSCYNAIRPTLKELEEEGLFDVYYISERSYVYDGETERQVTNTWQSVLQDIVRAHNVDTDLKLDVYYDTVTTALLNAMEVIKTDASFAPLAYYEPSYVTKTSTSTVSLGTVLFLTGTGTAARNNSYNQGVSMTDGLRGPYYSGVKDYDNWEDVSADFDMTLGGYDHLLVILLGIMLLITLVELVIHAAVRVFQLVLLYVVSPLFVSTIPLGDGSRFKAWKDALIVTTFSVFGAFIGMRLMMLYIPIIASSKLVLFENGMLDMISKAVLIWGGIEASRRSTQLIGGILMGEGSHAAMRSGDTTHESMAFRSMSGRAAMGALKFAGEKTSSAFQSVSEGVRSTASNLRESWGSHAKASGSKAEASSFAPAAVPASAAPIPEAPTMAGAGSAPQETDSQGDVPVSLGSNFTPQDDGNLQGDPTPADASAIPEPPTLPPPPPFKRKTPPNYPPPPPPVQQGTANPSSSNSNTGTPI